MKHVVNAYGIAGRKGKTQRLTYPKSSVGFLNNSVLTERIVSLVDYDYGCLITIRFVTMSFIVNGVAN